MPQNEEAKKQTSKNLTSKNRNITKFSWNDRKKNQGEKKKKKKGKSNYIHS